MATQLETVSLGRTDIRVSSLGLGVWQWGDRMMWQYGQGYDAADARQVFDAALAAGIHFIDTAEIYGSGTSERMLGQFLRETQTPVVVATKFAPLPWRVRSSSLVAALRRSLNRLGLSQVDLYQIHFPLLLRSVETWANALADAVEAGLTRAVGVSNFNVDQTRRAYDTLARRGLPLASNQIEYSLLHRQPEASGLIELCRELGVTIIAYSPIAKGMLSGKYTPDHLPPGRRARSYNRAYLARIQPLIGLLKEIGRAHGGKSTVQVSLNWLMCKGAVPIPGAKNLKQAQDNAGALGWRLTSDEVSALDKASEQI
jgi:aryl-alcohol dehydrogenase-like predicted oxidoreductase